MLQARSGGPRYAVALYRVSTAEQGHSGLGLEAQQVSVRAFTEAQGWTLVAEHSDVASCWSPSGSTASPGRRTPSRACWSRATRFAPPTCRGGVEQAQIGDEVLLHVIRAPPRAAARSRHLRAVLAVTPAASPRTKRRRYGSSARWMNAHAQHLHTSYAF
jgi:hypothetical protein